MKFRFSNWKPSLAMLGALTALAVTGCGDDGSAPATPADGDGGSQQGPDGGGGGGGDESTTDESTTKPTNTSEPGNGETTEPGNTNSDGETEPNPTTEVDGSTPVPGDDGGTEPPPASGDVDDLIASICDWEFRCCDDGERKFRFGPSITDAATCKERFVHELRNSNSTKNPFAGGPAAGGLLASLAYAINLGRVDVNADAVAACTEQWNALECNQPAPDEVERCTAGNSDEVNPCALNELFKPILEQDATCTPSLGQSGTNDIECVEGTSCLTAEDPANGNGVPSCIKRSVVEEPCTEDVDCDFGLYCDGSSCAEKGDLGDECSYEDDEGSGMHPNTCKPGLSCDPDSKECVAACSEGYECLVDSQCPADFSCAPVYADDDELFHVCRSLGSKTTDQCDDQNDCVADQYCNKGVEDTIGNCAGDKDVDEDCTSVAGECVEGTYCDAVDVQCKAYNTPDEQCTRADNTSADPKDFPECAPSTAGCFPRYNEDAVAVEYFCRNAKNANGADCWVPADCQSGKCEAVSDEELAAEPYRTGWVCTAGADVGDECDVSHSCRAGTVCDPVEAECVEQIAPGANCENPDTESADSYLCANSVCAEQWDMLICSDAPVPESAGGSGVTCDGNE
jgi:hypothetical protein